jgi:antitoxin ParD1/3/4
MSKLDNLCYSPETQGGVEELPVMNVSLTPELERWVQDRVATGRYGSASEVVREALRLMQDQQDSRAQWLAETRAKLQVGVDQLNRGEGLPGDAAMGEVRRRIKENRARDRKR